MSRSLQILFVEDNPADVDLLVRELRRAGFEVDWKCVQTEPDFLAQLDDHPDIILSDFAMPQFSGLRAAELLRDSDLNIPFILISGTVGEDVAVEAMKNGASDYLLKDRIARLGAAVEQALEKKRLRDEERRAAQMLRESEERFREQAEMLDHAHEAIIVHAILTGLVTFWNQGAERLYGWTAAEAQGQHIGDLIFVIPGAVERVTRQTLENGEWRGEHRHVSKRSRELTVSSHVTLLRDAAGAPKSALVINFDITGQKLLEEQFLRAQRIESIGTLASGVAHDLNNILAPILMSAPLLRDDLPKDFRNRIVNTIETSARRGAEIVKQVLTFARGVQGQRLLVQPDHMAEEMVKIAQETFPKSIAVTTRYPHGIWAVEGDPTQLHQILLNLCVNARDAMPDGGQLAIALENTTVDESFAAMVEGSASGPHVLISVTDTGTGIPRDVIDKIFDPFFTTKETGKGTGLGLSTVIGIVKSHAGFLTVDSEPGRGTTFKLFLPASPGEAAAVPSAAALPPGHGELILVVDDEESIRQVTRTILEKYGYRVITAGDGAAGVALFATRMDEIKVVLSDVMMPVMDGLSLARVLQRMNPHTPVIASSGHSEEIRDASLKDAGIKMLLRKPYDTSKLLTSLRSVLDFPQASPDQFSI